MHIRIRKRKAENESVITSDSDWGRRLHNMIRAGRMLNKYSSKLY